MNTARVEWMRLLTDAVADATGCDLATSAKQAEVILDHLSREYGGQVAYVPTISSKPLSTPKILRLLADGLSTREVAERYNVTTHTIRNYVRGGAKRVREIQQQARKS